MLYVGLLGELDWLAIGSLTRLMISLVHNEAGPSRSAISQYPVWAPAGVCVSNLYRNGFYKTKKLQHLVICQASFHQLPFLFHIWVHFPDLICLNISLYSTLGQVYQSVNLEKSWISTCIERQKQLTYIWLICVSREERGERGVREEKY